jgi:hypothetical protein
VNPNTRKEKHDAQWRRREKLASGEKPNRRLRRAAGDGRQTLARSKKTETGLGLAHERQDKTRTSKSGNSPRRKIGTATPTNHLDQDQGHEHKKRSQIWYQHKQDANSKYFIEI